MWSRFAGHRIDAAGVPMPPEWFETLCADLHFRRDSSKKAAAPTGGHLEKSSGAPGEGTPSVTDEPMPADGDDLDPYLLLTFDVLPEERYEMTPFAFAAGGDVFDADTRRKLVMSDGGGAQPSLVCFAHGYRFPDRRQLPTSEGTGPVKLWVDPAATVPAVFVQLSPYVPPLMWLPTKPTAAALRRVLSYYAVAAAAHRDEHHARYEDLWQRGTTALQQQGMPRDPPAVLRYLAWMATTAAYDEVIVREYPNYQDVFLGEFNDPEELSRHMDTNPFLFSIAEHRTVVNMGDTAFHPRVDGPGVATTLYRCVASKALLQVKVHLAAEVKLPPLNPGAFETLWKEAGANTIPDLRIPVFARVSWADHHHRMSGGAGRHSLVARFNAVMGTEFAYDMPVDAVMALFHTSCWIERRRDLLGVHGMRTRLQQLLTAYATHKEAPLLYAGTAEVPNPQYRLADLIGMHVQYLAHLGDPDAGETIRALATSPDAAIRMGCAKAALDIGDRELFKRIASSEPQGRMQQYMTRLVRKRKARDITDPGGDVRIAEEQFDLPSPVWVRGVRIDRSDPGGARDYERLATTGRVKF